MIIVKQIENRITVTGYAGPPPDLVCEDVTALFLGMVMALHELTQDEMLNDRAEMVYHSTLRMRAVIGFLLKMVIFSSLSLYCLYRKQISKLFIVFRWHSRTVYY